MCVLSQSKMTQSGGSAFFVPIKFLKACQITVYVIIQKGKVMN